MREGGGLRMQKDPGWVSLLTNQKSGASSNAPYILNTLTKFE